MKKVPVRDLTPEIQKALDYKFTKDEIDYTVNALFGYVREHLINARGQVYISNLGTFTVKWSSTYTPIKKVIKKIRKERAGKNRQEVIEPLIKDLHFLREVRRKAYIYEYSNKRSPSNVRKSYRNEQEKSDQS